MPLEQEVASTFMEKTMTSLYEDIGNYKPQMWWVNKLGKTKVQASQVEFPFIYDGIKGERGDFAVMEKTDKTRKYVVSKREFFSVFEVSDGLIPHKKKTGAKKGYANRNRMQIEHYQVTCASLESFIPLDKLDAFMTDWNENAISQEEISEKYKIPRSRIYKFTKELE